MKNYYHWGILGTGSIANNFAKGLTTLPQAILHSVHSRTYQKAQNFADKYGFKSTHRKSNTFLNDPELDIIYIATPHHLHCEQAIRCLRAGKHVLVEKPLALNAEKAKKIEQTAKKNDRFCMEAMWSRFLPLYQQVNKRLQNDAIGNIKFLSAEFGRPLVYDTKKFRFKLEKGGGSLLDLGVYPISLALMFLGEPERIEGICRKAKSGIDTFSRMSFYYEDDMMAELRSSFSCKLSNNMWIGGTKGAIEIPAPIYRPDYYRLHQYDIHHNQQKRTTNGFRSKLYKMPVISDMLPIIRNHILNPIREFKSKKQVPHKSNGYQYQAKEVMEVLDRGALESKVMPLRDSISVLEITDQLRKDWEIIFPQIDQKER